MKINTFIKDYTKSLKLYVSSPNGIALMLFIVASQVSVLFVNNIAWIVILSIAPLFVGFMIFGNRLYVIRAMCYLNKSLFPVELIKYNGQRMYTIARTSNEVRLWAYNILERKDWPCATKCRRHRR